MVGETLGHFSVPVPVLSEIKQHVHHPCAVISRQSLSFQELQ